MKKIFGIIVLLGLVIFAGCVDSEADTMHTSDSTDSSVVNLGTTNSDLILASPTITSEDTQLDFVVQGVDENKITYIYVANKKVLADKLVNGETYSIDIQDIKDAYRKDYQPKVQLVQTEDDTEFGNIITFKQVRYTVKDASHE